MEENGLEDDTCPKWMPACCRGSQGAMRVGEGRGWLLDQSHWFYKQKYQKVLLLLVVRSGEVISVSGEEVDQVIIFNLNLILCQY